MNLLQKIVAFFGRIFLSLIFILSSLAKIMNWQGTEQAVSNALTDLKIALQGMQGIQGGLETLLNWVPLLVVLAVVFELFGGLLIFLGIKVRFGAGLLLLFLIPTTLLFHHFWLLQGADRDLQMIMFLKNLSIFGGLLILLAFGTGAKGKGFKERRSEK